MHWEINVVGNVVFGAKFVREKDMDPISEPAATTNRLLRRKAVSNNFKRRNNTSD